MATINNQPLAGRAIDKRIWQGTTHRRPCACLCAKHPSDLTGTRMDHLNASYVLLNRQRTLAAASLNGPQREHRSDKERLLMISDNNRREFEAFFGRQYRGLVAFLGRRTATRADAEEIAQESCVRLLATGSFESRPEPVWKALLFRIAANLAVDTYRKARHYLDVAKEGAGDSMPAGTMADPSEHASADQALAAVSDELMRLPPRTRQVFLLSRAHGKSYAEIADICGVSTKAVEKHVSRALRRLTRVMYTHD